VESKRQLQESHDQMELVFNHAREIICTIDGNACLLTVSAACKKVLGLSERDLVGRSFCDLHAAADRARIDAAFRDMQSTIAASNFHADVARGQHLCRHHLVFAEIGESSKNVLRRTRA
jgi:PAS domain S-box-containing protein